MRCFLYIRLCEYVLRLRVKHISVKTNMFGHDRIFFIMGKKVKFEMEKFFVALSDRTRLRLINLIGEDEVCVCFFVAVLDAPQPKISRHLAYLRDAGMVEARRDGKWMHYKMAQLPHEHAVRIMKNVMDWLEADPEMQNDRAKLLQVCCAPMPPIQLLGAPRPSGIQSLASHDQTGTPDQSS